MICLEVLTLIAEGKFYMQLMQNVVYVTCSLCNMQYTCICLG